MFSDSPPERAAIACLAIKNAKMERGINHRRRFMAPHRQGEQQRSKCRPMKGAAQAACCSCGLCLALEPVNASQENLFQQSATPVPESKNIETGLDYHSVISKKQLRVRVWRGRRSALPQWTYKMEIPSDAVVSPLLDRPGVGLALSDSCFKEVTLVLKIFLSPKYIGDAMVRGIHEKLNQFLMKYNIFIFHIH